MEGGDEERTADHLCRRSVDARPIAGGADRRHESGFWWDVDVRAYAVGQQHDDAADHGGRRGLQSRLSVRLSVRDGARGDDQAVLERGGDEVRRGAIGIGDALRRAQWPIFWIIFPVKFSVDTSLPAPNDWT